MFQTVDVNVLHLTVSCQHRVLVFFTAFLCHQEQLGKKVFKKSWNCSSIADVQNYERMAKVLQVRCLPLHVHI